VSLPSYPSPAGVAARAPQPGLFPLRPLTVGEILSTALLVTRRYLAVLAPVGLLIGLLYAGATLGVAAATGSLDELAKGSLPMLPSNPTAAELDAYLPYLGKLLLGTAAGLLVSLIGAPFASGVAAPFAAQAAVTKSGAVVGPLTRLKGRWGVLLAASVVAGVGTTLGFGLLVVPGVLLWLILLPLGPVTAMEGLPVRGSLRRAMAVSKGVKGRILGVTLLATLFVGIFGFVVGTLFGTLTNAMDPVPRLLLTDGLTVLTSMLTVPFMASVNAMLYIDLRMRKEGLARALAAAAADGSVPN